MRLVLALVLFVLLTSLELAEAEQFQAVGSYDMIVKVNTYNYRERYASADVQIIVDMPPGDGFAYIAVPFPNISQDRFFIEPTSDDNLVLFGYIRPEDRYGVCAIALGDSRVHISMYLRSVSLPLHESSESESGVAIAILLGEVGKELEAILGDYARPRLNRLVVDVPNFQESRPQASPSEIDETRVIQFADNGTEPIDVVIFLTREANPNLLAIFLFGIPFVVGYAGAPRLVSVDRRPVQFLIGGTVGLIVVVFVYFGSFTPEQRRNEEAVIALGTGLGFLFRLVHTAVELRAVQRLLLMRS